LANSLINRISFPSIKKDTFEIKMPFLGQVSFTIVFTEEKKSYVKEKCDHKQPLVKL
jgi:hypothetical protein